MAVFSLMYLTLSLIENSRSSWIFRSISEVKTLGSTCLQTVNPADIDVQSIISETKIDKTESEVERLVASCHRIYP